MTLTKTKAKGKISRLLLNSTSKCYNYVNSNVHVYFIALKDESSFLIHKPENVVPGTDSNVVNKLHDVKFRKLEFFHDSTHFRKSHTCTYWLRNPSLDLCTLQHVKCINPSEAEREFHCLSGHVIELLSCCHPELLIKWCENLMVCRKYVKELLPPYFVFRLRQLKSSSAILKMMSLLWSWSNHSILKYLAEFSEMAATYFA